MFVHLRSRELTLRGGYYNHALRHVAVLFNKVILCIQEHAVTFVKVYAYPFIGKQIMNIKQLEIRRNVHSKPLRY